MAKQMKTNYDMDNDAAIEQWLPAFERAGFGDYAIDFSWVDPRIIEAMGKAAEKVVEEIGEESQSSAPEGA